MILSILTLGLSSALFAAANQAGLDFDGAGRGAGLTTPSLEPLRPAPRSETAFMAGAACAPYTMDIILGVFGKVIVNDKLYAGDINSSGGYIGCNEHPVFTYLETFERLPALSEGTV